MASLGSAASRAANKATSPIDSNSDSESINTDIISAQEQDGETFSTGLATSLQLRGESLELSNPAAKSSTPPPQGQVDVSRSTPNQKSAKAPRTPVKTAVLSTSSIALPALPTNSPIYGHMKVIIDNRYHTFQTHECDKIFNCPLIPAGTPSESRDTATRNHRSRHTIAKNWGVQLETLLRRAEDKMQLPTKYAKHLLSNLALLSHRVQDPNLALDLLARAYIDHRSPGDSSMLRVQDVKNTLEALDRASGRGAETRSGTGTGPANTQAGTPTPTATPNTRPRAPRSVQFDTPSRNSMPPPPTPLSKSKKSQLRKFPRQTHVDKDIPSASPSPELEKETATLAIPTHSRNTRAAGARGDGDLRGSGTYFLPADPEPPRKKRATGISKAKPVSYAGVAPAPPGATGTVGGIRMWNGKRIFDPDIGDIAAAYYCWQTSQYDEKECRRQIEKRREEDADRELQRQARASEAVENAGANNSVTLSEPTQEEVDKDGDTKMGKIPEYTVATSPSASSTPTPTEEITSDFNSTSPVLPLGIVSSQTPDTQSPVAQPQSEAFQLDNLPVADVIVISEDTDAAIDTPNPEAVLTTETVLVGKSSSVPVIDTPIIQAKFRKESPTISIPVSVPVAPTRSPFASVLSLMGFSSLQQEPPVASTSS
ncbi:hypothetical protein EV426DRAFT_575854 [Tirmania nivea]|nr:hypothetical protein EV426DRAFT_575854 [Tirmania nivea]